MVWQNRERTLSGGIKGGAIQVGGNKTAITLMLLRVMVIARVHFSMQGTSTIRLLALTRTAN